MWGWQVFSSNTIRGAVMMAASVLLCGCDGHVTVCGTVRAYAGRSQSSSSQALGPTKQSRTKPIPVAGASVTLFLRPLAEVGKADHLITQTTTDAQGGFDLSGVTAPNRTEFSLVVEKQGYAKVRQVLTKRGNRILNPNVVLVPVESPASKPKPKASSILLVGREKQADW